MPLQEYACTRCDHVEEVLESISEAESDIIKLRQCKCKGMMRKQISASSFRIKDGTPKFHSKE